jgi:hypothetical protein
VDEHTDRGSELGPYKFAGPNSVSIIRRNEMRLLFQCQGYSFRSVQGWINHVRYADTWGLRQRVLDTPWRRP